MYFIPVQINFCTYYTNRATNFFQNRPFLVQKPVYNEEEQSFPYFPLLVMSNIQRFIHATSTIKLYLTIVFPLCLPDILLHTLISRKIINGLIRARL